MPASLPDPDLFDRLRAGWKQQTNTPAVELEELRAAAESELQQQHRRHLRSTVLMSLSFIAAMAVTTWVFFRYDDHGPLFYGSIIAVNLLMIMAGTLMWLGVQDERLRSDLDNLAYIEANLRRLRIRRFTIRYAIPVYLVLLLTALFCYYADLFSEASLQLNHAVYGGTHAYVLGVFVLSRKKSRKKLELIKKLTGELELLRDGLRQE